MIDTMQLVKKAMDAFVHYWESNAKHTEPFDTTDKNIRNGHTAMEMLFNYIEERKPMLTRRDFKLLAVEQPFAVPLDPDNPRLVYVGRNDKITEYQKLVYPIEHKTSTSYKKDGPFQTSFVESFSPNSQVDGYLYATRHEYGPKLKAIWIDAALVHANVHDGFRFLQIDRAFAQIDGWLWEVLYWTRQIRVNTDRYTQMHNELPEMPFMPVWAKNTNSCTNYGGCPYLDVCKGRANPETHTQPPMGFREEKWEPYNELNIRKTGTIIRDVDPNEDEIYDNTRVQDFRACPRLYYYRHIRHWVPETDRLPLLFGGGWHAAMDVVWPALCGKD